MNSGLHATQSMQLIDNLVRRKKERKPERSFVRERSEEFRFLRITEESYSGLTVDALAPSADEGRGTLRKAPGSRVQALIRGSPNGETPRCEPAGSPSRKNKLGEGNLGN
jgi:hypothetical protein